MFINLSNHPSTNWSDEQIKAAQEYGEIIDIPSPVIEADCDENELLNIVGKYVQKILAYQPEVVMCQAEFTFTYAMVYALQKKGIKCLAACSNRVTEEKTQSDGSVCKTSMFKFARFREYVIE